jgi:hypothetical protein
VGFDTPEAAVTGFYDRLGSLDLQSATATFAPGEDAFAWLAQSWMPSAQAAVDRGRADGWSVDVSGLTYEKIGEGDHLTLRPLTFIATGTTPADFNDHSGGDADPSAGQSTGGPKPFRIERADGCTTVTGAAASTFGSEPPAGSTSVDGGFRTCGDGSDPLGGLLLFAAGGMLQLPSVSVVESGGQWYVSPLGTLLATATVGLHDIRDGSSLFRSILGPYIYGVPAGVLTSMVVGQSVNELAAECLPAVTVDNGVVTGVLDDPPVDAVRACTNGSFESSSSSSGSGFSPAPVVTATRATIAVESTTP